VRYHYLITPAQLQKYRELAERWEVVSPLPTPYALAPPARVEKSRPVTPYLGVWVGTRKNPRSIFIGIETDGYAHS
jgi:hypothetical protein